MTIWDAIRAHDFEQVIALNNNASGLRAFIVIHDTTRGPALGGIRVRPYASDVEALEDALRLARAMSYKAAMADLPCGGGKAVVIEHPEWDRASAMRALGRFIESLGGRFQTGRDLGLTEEDVRILREETQYIGCEGAEADEYTALGVIEGMRACVEHWMGARAGNPFAGLTIAVQGVGSVGWAIARRLYEAGARLIIADVDERRARAAERAFGARIVPPQEIYDAPADVFCPCAVGGVLTERTIAQLRAHIVAGSANNVLAEEALGWRLRERGILYAPDYVINAGALIHGANLYLRGQRENEAEVRKIYERVREILALAEREGLPTNVVADRLAESRLKTAKTYRDLFWGKAEDASGGCA
ncbi:MAG: leucine dehydrogenase [Blastocatellia bacterium]|nr:leucine dehydrogenase [Blastocatellia bacterium]MCS7158390.1 leucine dehydrogenase [Blastocatellia bacterium]MCX7752896.1 leucine dehydrogenase [Blastocatellia bacterium]MDW8167952.1 amino acid dehydrogenase [Acidobacteriota bacterium]MDW8255977.1 amino acid dehydrogenase [Acidobacteriota bacterium]